MVYAHVVSFHFVLGANSFTTNHDRFEFLCLFFVMLISIVFVSASFQPMFKDDLLYEDMDEKIAAKMEMGHVVHEEESTDSSKPGRIYLK